MIKRAIILHRSRPGLRLEEGGGGDAQITVQNPVSIKQGYRAPVLTRGSGRGKAIWVNPHPTRTKETIRTIRVEAPTSSKLALEMPSGGGTECPV